MNVYSKIKVVKPNSVPDIFIDFESLEYAYDVNKSGCLYIKGRVPDPLQLLNPNLEHEPNKNLWNTVHIFAPGSWAEIIVS